MKTFATRGRPIPEYLLPWIVEQNEHLYTPIDHAGWRFIMKLSQAYYAQTAHQIYLDGLDETGISTERIPLVSEIDLKLQKFGWRAVPIVGFIPPAVFMEFLSLGILPIGCDMRTLEHLSYTPSPDIVHEAAGHAPILADPAYAEYLNYYGELARKVIFSSQDIDVYNAIRKLSDIKEDPKSSKADIISSEKNLEEALASVTIVSEATWLARMSWWTIEYGLVGSMQSPKIYGAGLLSSVFESYHAFNGPKLLPLTLDCIHQGYDITKPQPQLYVARDFRQLVEVLRELEALMAFRIGGVESLERAKNARTVTTTVLDSGLQISGVVAEFTNSGSELEFVKFSGPVQLAFQDVELPGQGVKTHGSGFSSPIGQVKGLGGKSACSLDEAALRARGFLPDQIGSLEFESGITLTGRLRHLTRKNGQVLTIQFEECTIISSGGRTLYEPDWGPFDLACGSRVVSVFGGSADRVAYLRETGGFHQVPAAPKTNLTSENRALNALYAEIRTLRESKKNISEDRLQEIASILATLHTDDWLLRYELLEIAENQSKRSATWALQIEAELKLLATRSQDHKELISRGLELFARPHA